jgi:hypothetical protein
VLPIDFLSFTTDHGGPFHLDRSDFKFSEESLLNQVTNVSLLLKTKSKPGDIGIL